MHNFVIPFSRFCKPILTAYAITFIIAIAVISTRGFNLSLDFTGGIEISFISSGEVIDTENIKNALEKNGFENPIVQKSGNTFIAKIGSTNSSNAEATHVKDAIYNAFTKTDITFERTDFISPIASSSFISSALVAVLFALVGIGIYIIFRFNFTYGIGAILTLAHDIILTLGFISMCNIEFDISSIAALLTILGYSINDSIIIYDRIREVRKGQQYENLGNLIDAAIMDVMPRTIITSTVTLISILVIVFFGGKAIHDFALITTFGIVAGTFSSICVSAMSLLFFRKKHH